MSDIKAIIILPTGGVGTLDTVPDLAKAQELVGGYIEPIDVGDAICFVNEEGIRLGLSRNDTACRLLSNYGDLVAPILGPMLIVGPRKGGDWTALSSKWIEEATIRGLRVPTP